MTTEDRLKSEIELLRSLLNHQAEVIKKQKAEMESVRLLVIEALLV